MIRLFTLDSISAFSSDTIYKICLAAEKYGLADENIAYFPTPRIREGVSNGWSS